MDPLKKRQFLSHARNEYLGAVLAAKLARRIHAMAPEDRPDANVKETSLAIRMITEGDVEYEMEEKKDEEEAEEE